MSGPNFLLDTNVLIGLFGRNEEVLSLLSKLEILSENCFVSLISRMEILGYSELSEEEFLTVREKMTQFHIVEISPKVELKTIEIKRKRKVKLPDAIILASAIVHGLKLITFDKRLEQIYKGIVEELKLATDSSPLGRE